MELEVSEEPEARWRIPTLYLTTTLLSGPSLEHGKHAESSCPLTEFTFMSPQRGQGDAVVISNDKVVSIMTERTKVASTERSGGIRAGWAVVVVQVKVQWAGLNWEVEVGNRRCLWR
jgi:hypothetical protein